MNRAFCTSAVVLSVALILGTTSIATPRNAPDQQDSHAPSRDRDARARLLPADYKLQPDAESEGYGFGRTLAIAGDTMIIAAVGYAHVYIRNGDLWELQQTLSATSVHNPAARRFGVSVAVSGDTVVVEALDQTTPRTSLYVFKRNRTTWVEEAEIPDVRAPAISGDTILAHGSVDGQVETFNRIDGSWSLGQPLAVLDGLRGGDSIGISGDTALIGVPGADGGEGAAHVFERTGGVWSEVQVLKIGDGTRIWDSFGASIDLDGDTAIIGSPKGQRGGEAIVFSRSDGTWVQQASLALETNPYDLGCRVALSGDLAVLHACAALDVLGLGTYVFSRSGAEWTLQAKLVSPDDRADDFGSSVAIADGTVFVGAPNAPIENPTEGLRPISVGAVYGCLSSPDGWGCSVTGDASPAVGELVFESARIEGVDGLGRKIAISGDTALVASDSFAEIFTFADGVWNREPAVARDLGRGIAMAISGDTLLFGTRQRPTVDVLVRSEGQWTKEADFSYESYFGPVAIENDTAFVSHGAGGSSSIYERDRDGEWIEVEHPVYTAFEAALADGVLLAFFGSQVSVYVSSDEPLSPSADSPDAGLEEPATGWQREAVFGVDSCDAISGWCSLAFDGRTAVIGDSGSGKVHVFTRDADGNWSDGVVLESSDASAREGFGKSVAVLGDSILVGAPDGTGSGVLSGAAYWFRRVDGIWTQQAKLVASDAEVGDRFGTAVALTEGAALVGAPGTSSFLDNPGSLYHYALPIRADTSPSTGCGCSTGTTTSSTGAAILLCCLALLGFRRKGL